MKSQEIAQRIRQVRESRKMTQAELAEKLKTDRVYITQLEGGKINMSIDYLQRVCDALGCKLRVILEG